MAEDRNTGGAPWQFRRRLAIGILLYCAGMSSGSLFLGVEMAGAVLAPMAGIATIVISAYFAGAVWEDHSIRTGKDG